MNWKNNIKKEFKECLKLFPEINNLELIIMSTGNLSGVKGHSKTKDFVCLFVPPNLRDKPRALRPIILHELSHTISIGREECERIFYERADEKSKKLWDMLKEANAIRCEDLRG